MQRIIVAFVFLSIAVCHCAVLERVYENLGSFSQPIDIQQQGDFVYVVERRGAIMVFSKDNPQSKSTFLDIETRVDDQGAEEGLLGLAFHPNFASNNRFFVYYTNADGNSLVSEFTANSMTSANSQSERIFMTIAQPFSNHNGGQLQFGPDGNLYIAVGDGGSGGDPMGNGQNTNTLLGNILRINVNQEDPPLLYSIPASNPFASGGGAPEIYSYGLRNPWRFSFDSQTGLMWIGDVGQAMFEEISVSSQPGENFGWADMEACVCVTSCNPSNYVQPIHSYPRDVGTSVTGGYVYRGTNIPELTGHYIFGDFVAGDVFELDADQVSQNCGTSAQVLFNNIGGISTFGLIDGEVYVADYISGFLNRISPDSNPTPTQSPSAAQSSTATATRTPAPSNSAAPFPNPPASYENRVSGSQNGRSIDIEWELDGAFIHFRVSAVAAGWIALGFSSDGSMSSSGQGSDIVMGYVDNSGTPHVNDYFVEARIQPELDEQQNLANTNAVRNGNILEIVFTRRLITGDNIQDREISVFIDQFLIWALSDTMPASIDSFARHDARDSILVDLDPSGAISASSSPAPSPSNTRTASNSPAQSSPTPSSTRFVDSPDSTDSSDSTFSTFSPFTSGFTSFSPGSASSSSVAVAIRCNLCITLATIMLPFYFIYKYI